MVSISIFPPLAYHGDISSSHGLADLSNPGLMTRFVGIVGLVGLELEVGNGVGVMGARVIGACVTGLFVGDWLGSSDIIQGGSESKHKTPLSRILLVQQLDPPPGRLPQPLPPQVPHDSKQHISLLNTSCGHVPGDTGVDVVGFDVGFIVVGFDVGLIVVGFDVGLIVVG